MMRSPAFTEPARLCMLRQTALKPHAHTCQPCRAVAVPDVVPPTSSTSEERGAEQPAPPPKREPVRASLSAEQLARSEALQQGLKGKSILAPLTRANHIPFRRLCGDFGCEVTMSEMAFARHLIKGDKLERARMRRSEHEACFGFQMATNQIGEGVQVAKMAAEAGASWLDLNCGCPIYEATRRGLGSALLRSPAKLSRLVAGIAEGSPLPLTVKVRLGVGASKMVAALHGAGAAAVSVHGRTAEQRYKRPADWGHIRDVVAADTGPVIGNGDILTHYEARDRLEASQCWALMVGRGALIKPWIFQEIREQRTLTPTAEERVGIYRQLVFYMKEHFGDDAKGRKKAFYFLPWHMDFLCRYRPLPEAVYGEASRERPLIATRVSLCAPELGEGSPEGLPPLERLLRCESPAAHEAVAALLWDSESDAAACRGLGDLAARELEGYEHDMKLKAGRERDEATAEG